MPFWNQGLERIRRWPGTHVNARSLARTFFCATTQARNAFVESVFRRTLYIQAHARLMVHFRSPQEAGATWIKTKFSQRPAQSRPSLVLSAHLHLKAVWILDVETSRGFPDLQPPTLQLSSNRVPYLLVRVPVGDRVGDVIDTRRVGRPATRVTSDDERIAYRETALFSIVPRNLHPEQIRVEIACLPVIGHLIRNMVDVNGLGYFGIGRGCRRCARGCRRCRQGQALN